MKTPRRPAVRILKSVLVLVLFTTICISPAMGQNKDRVDKSDKNERVVIKGKGIVASYLRTPLHLTLVVGDSACVWVKMKGRGRFQIESDEDQVYKLHFEQDGSITKIVQVDTKYAERKIGSKKRFVKFDVIMEPTSADRGYRYTGPVGRIAFHRSNGRMDVKHSYVRNMDGVKVVGE